MTSGGPAWWAGRIRQFRAHLSATVSPGERATLAGWLTPTQLSAFDAMAVADRRHGLDVMTSLRTAGVDDPEVLLAGLLHDSGKGQTGVVPRVIHTLGGAYGSWIPRIARLVPGMGVSLARLADHPEQSARIALGAGCTERTADLIRWQEAPRDPEFGERLRLADEAN
ncbi:MAG: hypothetical protein ABIQ17_02290 [Candidatus Limnocylindrales bacterium]